MKLLIHVGTDKTGSKALQYFLNSPRNVEVLNCHHLRYLVAGQSIPPNHQALFWDASKDNFHGWRTVAEEVRQYPDFVSIISFEGFYNLTVERWQRVKEILSGIDMNVVIYLRRQTDYVCSGIAQLFKQGTNQPLVKYTHGYVSEHCPSYPVILDRLEQVFGFEAVHVHRYERSSMIGGNLIRDFVSAFGLNSTAGGLADEFEIGKDPNPSLSVEAILTLDTLDQEGVDKGRRQEIVTRLLAECAGTNTTFVKDETMKFIERSMAVQNKQIAAKWFSAEELFLESPRFVFAEPDPLVMSRFRLIAGLR